MLTLKARQVKIISNIDKLKIGYSATLKVSNQKLFNNDM